MAAKSRPQPVLTCPKLRFFKHLRNARHDPFFGSSGQANALTPSSSPIADFATTPTRVIRRAPDARAFAALDVLRKTLAGTPEWVEATTAAGTYIQGPPQPMRLAPTARSALAG